MLAVEGRNPRPNSWTSPRQSQRSRWSSRKQIRVRVGWRRWLSMRTLGLDSGLNCSILCIRCRKKLPFRQQNDFISQVIFFWKFKKLTNGRNHVKFSPSKLIITNLINPLTLLSHNITPNFFHKFLPSMQQPQDSLQSSRLNLSNNGLKQYVVTASQCQHMRKRIKILAQLQNHNEAKVRQQQRSLEKIESLKKEKQQNGTDKDELMRRRKQEEEELRMKSKRMKTENKSKINELIKEIEHEKMQDRNKIKEQSLHIAKKINENKEKELQEKKQKRNRVKKVQQECKENYNSFFLRKREDLAVKNQMQMTWFDQKRKQKDQQMMAMSSVEADLLNKHSQTIQQYDRMKAKLGLIYKTPVVKRSLGKLAAPKLSQHLPLSPILNKKQIIESL